MTIITGTKTIFVDIDETLVMWNGVSYTPNQQNINAAIRFANRGHTLIAWSAGGAEWAARIILELELTDIFKAIISKPDWFIDDKSASEFMPETNRVYFSPLTSNENESIVESRERDWSQVSKFVTSKEEG